MAMRNLSSRGPESEYTERRGPRLSLKKATVELAGGFVEQQKFTITCSCIAKVYIF